LEGGFKAKKGTSEKITARGASTQDVKHEMHRYKPRHERKEAVVWQQGAKVKRPESRPSDSGPL